MEFMNQVESLIENHEGFRQYKYLDTRGNETIGIGFLLSQGLTYEESRLVLRCRIDKIISELSKEISFFNKLSNIRQMVLIDMAYNLGVGGLLAFNNMISALSQDDYELAGDEMQKSLWFNQAGNRSVNLQYMMKNDAIPEVALIHHQ